MQAVSSALVIDAQDSLSNRYRLVGTVNVDHDTISYRLQSDRGTPLSLSYLGGLSAMDLPVRPREGWQDEATTVVKGLRSYTITQVA